MHSLADYMIRSIENDEIDIAEVDFDGNIYVVIFHASIMNGVTPACVV